MKSLDQFNDLSAQEAMDINGGAGLADIFATVNSLLAPTATAASASLLILTAGSSAALNTIAGGLATFLSKLSIPSL